MFTDIAGYTTMAQRNEQLALELLEQHRTLLRACIQRHGGEEIKTMGDGFLVVFVSALEAVRCALAMQQALHESNEKRQPEKRIALRIGVHVGEVVHSKGDIYGDAVNVASRIEPLAGGGEIFITQQVYDHIRNKLENPVGYLGRRSLKNVDLPVDVYKVVPPVAQSAPVVSQAPTKNRVAVLPFASISPDPADEYLADGLTEELITMVSKVGNLRVTSRTSAMRYKGTTKALGQIAQELNVGTVLEGSVRKAGNKLRISVQLIDVHKDEQLWSQSYDRELEDIFDIQSDVARRVVGALEVHLLAKEKQSIERKPTRNIEAYTLYLKGLHYRGEGTHEGIGKAIQYLQAAVARDPRFAMAYAALADCHATLGTEGEAPPKENFTKATEYATKALELDDSIPEAHATLGLMLEDYYLDMEGAEREFRRALGLNPSYGRVCKSYGAHLACLGRIDEAISEIKRAQELNPLAIDVNECAAIIYNCANQYAEAVDACQRMLELNPDHFPALCYLAETYSNQSMFKEAIEVLQRALAVSNGAAAAKGRLGYAYARSGRRGEAEAVLQELAEDSKRKYVTPVAFAMVHSGLGNKDQAFEWLKRAYTERPGSVLAIKLRPMYAGLRTDPRFGDLLQKLHLEGGGGPASLDRP
jgi:TolB-like protein/Tfp pilus assembly protein PilF